MKTRYQQLDEMIAQVDALRRRKDERDVLVIPANDAWCSLRRYQATLNTEEAAEIVEEDEDE